jgi:predicted XRE-type DNA-binding protein
MAVDKMSGKIEVEKSGGNVFADIGMPNADEHLVKASIALVIARIIRKRGLTQEQAGEILGLDQPKVSNLVRGQLDKFTIDRLMRYMRKLDYDVTISFKPKTKLRNEAIYEVDDTLVPSV